MILVIDDDYISRLLVCDILESNGYSVIDSNSALDAINIIKTNKLDLVICDMMMPELNGLQVLSQVKNHYAGPFIFLSGSLNLADKTSALEAGATDFLIKPIDDEQLLRSIRQILL